VVRLRRLYCEPLLWFMISQYSKLLGYCKYILDSDTLYLYDFMTVNSGWVLFELPQLYKLEIWYLGFFLTEPGQGKDVKVRDCVRLVLTNLLLEQDDYISG